MTPNRILIDTNVLVSALLFGGVPGRLVEAARSGAIEGVVSLHILDELRTVLTRPRFGIEQHVADALAEEIATFCAVVAVELADGVWSPDSDEDPVVEAALRGRVGLVVTGDAHLLGLDVAGVRFLTPREALEALGL